ncbi:Hypothetical predicted protein, partial [Paramuricea clavata]
VRDDSADHQNAGSRQEQIDKSTVKLQEISCTIFTFIFQSQAQVVGLLTVHPFESSDGMSSNFLHLTKSLIGARSRMDQPLIDLTLSISRYSRMRVRKRVESGLALERVDLLVKRRNDEARLLTMVPVLTTKNHHREIHTGYLGCSGLPLLCQTTLSSCWRWLLVDLQKMSLDSTVPSLAKFRSMGNKMNLALDVALREIYFNVNDRLDDAKTSSFRPPEGIDNANLEMVRRNLREKRDDMVEDEATALFEVFGTKQKIRINKILKDHGLYAPHNMANDLQYVITLPTADEIMNAQSGETVEGYTLENIELEYESIDNIDLARKAENLYGSERELSFEHVTLMKKTEWSKDSTIINETINVPRRCMKAIVMLFTNKTKTDSEEYVYPNIEKVKVTVEGVPNAVYSQEGRDAFLRSHFRIVNKKQWSKVHYKFKLPNEVLENTDVSRPFLTGIPTYSWPDPNTRHQGIIN